MRWFAVDIVTKSSKSTVCVVCIYSTSQLRAATFQVLSQWPYAASCYHLATI